MSSDELISILILVVLGAALTVVTGRKPRRKLHNSNDPRISEGMRRDKETGRYERTESLSQHVIHDIFGDKP